MPAVVSDSYDLAPSTTAKAKTHRKDPLAGLPATVDQTGPAPVFADKSAKPAQSAPTRRST